VTGVSAQDRAIAEQLRLRAPPPVAVRLSRKAVILSVLIGGTALSGVIGWGLMLKPPPTSASSAEPPPATPGEHLLQLPRDYAAAAAAPRLGPPLPGDLGRAMLEPATREEASVGDPPQTGSDPDAQARASGLFAGGAARAAASGAPATAAGSTAETPPSPAAGPVLLAGTAIRAALVTGIRSDLPGPVTAQVTENVHDSVTGKVLLVPQGSRLLGAYDHEVRFGQGRVRVTWTRLVLPDGRSVALDGAPATDAAGYAGLEDRVDRKWTPLLGASLVALGLSAATAVADGGSDDELARALRRGGSDAATLAAGQVVSRSLDLRPSLTVRPGHPVLALLTRDLVLPPWTPQ
jgi:type IV secretion system protein VirB10